MSGQHAPWHFPRLPEGLIYVVVVAALLVAALGRRENADAPPAPPPLSSEEGKLLPSASTFASQAVVKVSADPSGPMSGTAFSIDPKGVWLTARHVVSGCTRVGLMEAQGKAAAAKVLPGPADGTPTDVAVLISDGGAPALVLASNGGLRIGERGFHPGYPQARAGEMTTRLLGRQTLEFHSSAKIGKAAVHRESVLAWAEAGRTGGLRGDLSGLSGAPVLDARNQVVGVTLAEAPRRGRIYAAPFDAIRQTLTAAKITAPPASQPRDPVSVDNYGRVADDLRRDLSVAQVVCLDGR